MVVSCSKFRRLQHKLYVKRLVIKYPLVWEIFFNLVRLRGSGKPFYWYCCALMAKLFYYLTPALRLEDIAYLSPVW